MIKINTTMTKLAVEEQDLRRNLSCCMMLPVVRSIWEVRRRSVVWEKTESRWEWEAR